MSDDRVVLGGLRVLGMEADFDGEDGRPAVDVGPDDLGLVVLPRRRRGPEPHFYAVTMSPEVVVAELRWGQASECFADLVEERYFHGSEPRRLAAKRRGVPPTAGVGHRHVSVTPSGRRTGRSSASPPRSTRSSSVAPLGARSTPRTYCHQMTESAARRPVLQSEAERCCGDRLAATGSSGDNLIAVAGLLAARGVELIVVGGCALRLHGRDHEPGDLDLVPGPSAANLRRLFDTLDAFGTVGRVFRPNDHALATRDIVTRVTPVGAVDVLLRGGREEYVDLAGVAIHKPAGRGSVPVAPLDYVLAWRVRFGKVGAHA